MRGSFNETVQIGSVYAGSFGGAIFTGTVLGRKYPLKFRANYKILTRTPESGEFWSIKGEIIRTEQYGKNVIVSECIIVPLPADNYLSSLLIKHPNFRGIHLGPKKVKQLIEKIGSSQLVRLLDAGDYSVIANTIALPIAKALCSKWNPLHEEMKLAHFLMENHLDPSLAKKIIKVCKYNSLERIQSNPYGLLAFGSITKNFWNAIDKTALQLGFSNESIERKVGAVEYVLYQHLMNGDTAMSEHHLQSNVSSLIGIGNSKNAIDEACKVRAVCFFTKDKEKYFQTAGVGYIEALLEEQISNLKKQRLITRVKVKELVSAIELYSVQNHRDVGYPLTNEQKSAVKMSLTSRISVITGYGGTGKTTVLKAVVDIAERFSRNVYILALAGKAKERAREATGRDDITFTIHGFIKQLANANTTLQMHKPIIIIDEASMVDISLASRLLRHLENTNFSLLLVGDTGQLSPVGFGLFFHVCVGRLPTSNLTEVHRQTQGSPIHQLSMSIRNGVISNIPKWNKEDEGVFFVPCEPNQKDLIKKIIEISKTHIGQVISPHASHSMIDNTKAINQSMQFVCNQGDEDQSIKLGSSILKENDPIIVTSNNYELELFNGMTGSIIGVEFHENTENIIAEFNNRVYTLSKDQCFELGINLAYAITIHKSQGSEYDNTIICCVKESKLLERSMIYTALTRSKKRAIFVGEYEVFKRAIKKLPRSETIIHGFNID